MTTGDATDAQANWIPPGIANPLGATFAHAVCGEDAVLSYLILGKETLFASTWAGRTGISEPRFGADVEWARSVRVELGQARPYAEAVFAQTKEYLDSISSEDLDQVVDLSAYGFGERTIAWMLQALIISHLNNMTGEISSLKGLQGAAGYPF